MHLCSLKKMFSTDVENIRRRYKASGACATLTFNDFENAAWIT